MDGTLPIVTEETEKMVALKKAYAEMILNTAKEAAARVMAAERKSKIYEHHLKRTKEEALRILLRFKQMIQDKNMEAEVASLNQQRRIQELELQLDEAEGLILDLRAKLDKVHDQLDYEKSKSVPSLRPNQMVDMSSCQASFSELESKSVLSDIQTSSRDPSIQQCPRTFTGTATSSSEFDGLVDNPVFAYIVFEKREPESHRVIWTQNIHAVEKGLVDEKMSQVDDSHPLAKSISIIRRNGGNHSLHSLTDKPIGIENIMKKAPVSEDTGTKFQPVNAKQLYRRKSLYGRRKVNVVKAAQCLKEIGTIHRPVKSQKLCKRKILYGKTKAFKCRYISNPCLKSQQTFPVIARCKSYSVSGKEVDQSETITEAENSSDFVEKAQLRIYQHVRRSLRKRRVKCWGATICRPVETDHESYQNVEAAKYSEESGEYLLEVKHEGESEDAKDKAAFATVRNTKVGGASCFDEVAEKETKLIHQPMLVKHNAITPEIQVENENLVSSEKRNVEASELTKDSQSSPESNCPLSYTFSRKRKNGFLVNHAEECSLSDSRRLVKVARQLISLSGKM